METRGYDPVVRAYQSHGGTSLPNRKDSLMAAKSDYSKRTEFWTVQKDRRTPSKGTKVIRKAAVRNSLGQFGGATNYRVGRTVQGARIQG